MILAGDISPIDVISHLPVACEEASLPYAYVPSRLELGESSLTKRPTSVIMVQAPKKESDYADSFEECAKAIRKLHK